MKGIPHTPTVPLNLFFSKRLLVSCFKLAKASRGNLNIHSLEIIAVCRGKGMLNNTSMGENGDIFLSGGRLEGASWNFQSNGFKDIDSPNVQNDFPIIHLSSKILKGGRSADVQSGTENIFYCPAYAGRGRYTMLFSINVQTIRDYQYWVRKGVAICFSTF